MACIGSGKTIDLPYCPEYALAVPESQVLSM